MINSTDRKPKKKKHMVAGPIMRQSRVLRKIDDSKRNFEIILRNTRIPSVLRTVDIVRGAAAARAVCDFHNGQLTQAEKDSGWICSPNATAKKPWPKPGRHSINPSGKSEGYGKR